VRLSQIALSTSDVRRSQRWYRDVLGLEPAGGTNLFAGPLSSMVQGVPRSASTCWWLVDRQDHFQVELFEFRSPLVRALPDDWRPCDVGYSTMSFAVADLDATMERARTAGSPTVTEPIGAVGQRRVCLRGPDGVLVELLEDDPRAPTERPRPRPEIPAVARSVTLSVPDLEPTRRFFADVLGLTVADDLELHRGEHEALWGLDGAQSERLCLWADDFVVELASYSAPTPKPWPDGYRISDLGLLNIAFGFRDRAGFEAAVRRCRQAGFEGNGPPLRLGAWSVIYVNDDQGFSVELLHVEPWYERRMGFRPRPTPRVAPFAGRTPARTLRTPRRFNKALITGAAGGIGSELARLVIEDRTRVVLADRSTEPLDELWQRLGSRPEVETLVADFSDLEVVDEAMKAVVADDPDIDLLIAAAGVDRAQSMLDFDWRQAREDFHVNALSNLVVLSHLAPAMAARGRGHVTAIASLAGLVGMPYEAAYSGSKAALATFAQSARAELEPRGITFTEVFPGFVDTPMFRANAFKHTYSVTPRDAAELIYVATLKRRGRLGFPVVEYAKARLASALPASLRDPLTRAAMNSPIAAASRPDLPLRRQESPPNIAGEVESSR
jgi:short-subunit dehydrogenase/catechol 2,3-dioxygenase-like lactoylglutathione lyase family enzyme